MIVTCKFCQTKYYIKQSGYTEGKKLGCTYCDHVWEPEQRVASQSAKRVRSNKKIGYGLSCLRPPKVFILVVALFILLPGSFLFMQNNITDANNSSDGGLDLGGEMRLGKCLTQYTHLF